MNRLLLLPLLAAGGVGLYLLSDKDGGVRPISDYKRGMVVGDSHSEASWTFGGLMGQFLRDQGLESRVVGKRGWSVDRYLSSGTLARELQAFRPDLLLVALGANDQPKGEESYKAKVRRFAELAREAGVEHIVWFGPSKSDGPQAYRMEARRRVARWQKEALSDLASWKDSMVLTMDLPTRDGVHMREPEYLEWSRRAQALLV